MRFSRPFPRLSFILQASFKRKMFLYMVMTSLIPVLLLGIAASWIASSTVQQEVNLNHQVILKQVHYQVDDLIKRLDQAAVHLASNELVIKAVKLGPSLDNVENALSMAEVIKKQRNYADVHFNIALWFRDYHKVYTTWDGLLNEEDYKYIRYADLAPLKYNAMSFIPPNSYPEQPHLLLMRPVPLTDDKPAGIIVIELDQSRITEIFRQAKLGENRKLLVLDENGTIVASQQPSEVGSKLTSTSELYRFWSDLDSEHPPLKLGGTLYNLSAQRSSLNNWTYIAMTPTQELNAKSAYILYVTWGFVGILIILWLVVVFIGSNRLYNPIQRLTTKLASDSRNGMPFEGDGLQAIDAYIQHIVRTNDRLKSENDVLFPWYRESVLLAFLRGELMDPDISAQTNIAALPISGHIFYVCMAEIDDYSVFAKMYNAKDRSLLRYALRKIIEELFAEHFEVLTAAPTQGQVAVIIGLDHQSSDSEKLLQQIGEDILKHVPQYFSFTVTITISSPYKMYTGIHSAYQEAAGLLDYRLILGRGQLITPKEIAPDLKQSRADIVKQQKTIIECLSSGDLEEARKQLSELEKTVLQHVHNTETVIGLFSHLLAELEFLTQSLGKDTTDVFDRDLYRDLHRMTSLEEITHWYADTLFPAVIGRLQSPDRQTALVHQAVLYMRDHLESDISLQLVAEQIGISYSHLSKVFKEVKGQNFIDYLIEYRMKVAMEWLAHTDMPIKEIAERLRYTNVQNFSRTFKQFADLPPGQYRSKFRS